ncbi:MAG: hypothetical protein U5K29_11610 [Acidimicrobiales bacterium]|nr:hypothetical protein [Acidimicrobiales bacterium]
MNGPGWLAAVAIVTTVNPERVARVAGGLAMTSRPTGGPPARVAALGAGIAATLFVVLAAIASPLLEAIDVSAPTAMVAVGLVLMGTGVKDLFVGPPTAEPAMDAWKAALVPVAVPAVARPQVGLLAVAAGASYGMAPVVAGSVAMVIGVGAATAVGGAGVRGRLMRWLGLVGLVVTVVAGATFAVEGVFSV